MIIRIIPDIVGRGNEMYGIWIDALYKGIWYSRKKYYWDIKELIMSINRDVKIFKKEVGLI